MNEKYVQITCGFKSQIVIRHERKYLKKYKTDRNYSCLVKFDITNTNFYFYGHFTLIGRKWTMYYTLVRECVCNAVEYF